MAHDAGDACICCAEFGCRHRVGQCWALLSVRFCAHSFCHFSRFVFCQFLAWIWYCLSYIPFARYESTPVDGADTWQTHGDLVSVWHNEQVLVLCDVVTRHNLNPILLQAEAETAIKHILVTGLCPILRCDGCQNGR